MDPARAFYVRTPAEGYSGSAYLLAPGLLLTAGHIVADDPRGPWKAYRLDGAEVDRDGPVTATVAWHDRKSDLAVLNFESPHRRPDDALVIPLGRMPSDARLDA